MGTHVQGGTVSVQDLINLLKTLNNTDSVKSPEGNWQATKGGDWQATKGGDWVEGPTPPAPNVGLWGGTCECPNGQRYEVGDNNDNCNSLACLNGRKINCNKGPKSGPGPWSWRRVKCNVQALVTTTTTPTGTTTTATVLPTTTEGDDEPCKRT